MTEKWTIKTLIDMKRNIDILIDEAVDRAVPDGIVAEGRELADDAQWFRVNGAWECPDSPFGFCMYHIIHDRAMDDCVFCHEPYERK